jgi:FlaA1/EpsC-like NDP-sugar epimerase
MNRIVLLFNAFLTQHTRGSQMGERYWTIWNQSDLLRRLSASPRIALFCIQPAIFATAGGISFLIRFELNLPAANVEHLLWALPIWVLTKAIVFRLLKLDRGSSRFISVPDLLRLGLGNVLGSAISALMIILLAPRGFPRSIFLLDLLLSMYGTAGVQLLARILRDVASGRMTRRGGKRVLIYGAGTAGVMLLREFRANARLACYEVRGFVDDNPHKVGMFVLRLPVLGVGADLPAIAARHRIEAVLVAIPSANGAEMTRIFEQCQSAGVRCKAIPGLADLIDRSSLAVQIRDVAVEDLLCRTPVCLNENGLREKLQEKTVLVTGAAGSIGSELCRQVALLRPGAIVAYDIAETGLFHLESEMRSVYGAVPFFAEIGSIQNRARVSEVFARYTPSMIYHAAAYKHVSMMEGQLFEALENNVLGTWNVAHAAAEYNAADFVMISSDKAVRPTGIMGLTKRVAELMIQSLEQTGTKFVSVRFGNVLGSSGSVVPTFKKQIAAGGPVTVTHPEMRRYFMTIPEAVHLVLQASTMGKGGEIFVLDMGQPVRIVDLARRLIILSGLEPDRDIRVEFTGIRPGEKLYEELSAYEENTLPTYHEKIKIFSGNGVPGNVMEPYIDTIRRYCGSRDAKRLVFELKRLVPDYNPSPELLCELLFGQKAYDPVSVGNGRAVAAAHTRAAG